MALVHFGWCSSTKAAQPILMEFTFSGLNAIPHFFGAVSKGLTRRFFSATQRAATQRADNMQRNAR
jgi:hypothetical protein